MLQTLLHIKLAAMVAALGLDTKEWKNPSQAMVGDVQKLADSMSNVGKPGESDKVQGAINETLKDIQKLAEGGDKDALFALGLFTQQQKEQGALEKAMEYYKKAADKGQLQAMNNLGFLIAGSSKDPEKQKEGVAMIKKAADEGNNPARRNMAQIYLNGLGGTPRDANAAEKLLTMAANEKDGDAAFALSQFYMGQGGKEKQNDETGWEWLNKAATYGNANALDLLGTLYFQGGKIGNKEIAKDEKAAVEKFKTLAEAGNPVGQRKMATLLESGTVPGVAKDFNKAFEGYKLAAQGNDAFAQFRLASMYDSGVRKDPKDEKSDWLVAPDAATALSLYRLAAQNNLPIAAYNTGVFYEQGRSVDRDYAKAFTYYMAAAQAGVGLAMQKVGDFYLNGATPIMKDPVAAAAWYAHSAEAGVPEGHLSEGFLIENGVGTKQEDRYYDAASNYMKAADSPNASDTVRLLSFMRLGGLYFRGLLAPKGETTPDYGNAYIFFQQAAEIDPNNKAASEARDTALAKVDKSKKKELDEKIVTMKKDRDARNAKARAAASADASKPAAPVAEPAPEPATPVKKPKKK
jgi:TPR repeat protein